jgi:hypothetical protein
VERLLAWYRVGSSVGAVVALILANVVPLAGVLWFGWSVWTILVIYWLENGIVGLFNVLKMAAASGSGKSIIPFFIVHYGMFWLVHGIFVMTLPLFATIGSSVELEPIGMPVPPMGVDGTGTASAGPNLAGVAIAGIFLFISHGLSYLFNYLGRGEYLRTTAGDLMFAPYKRLVILHLTIIFGGLAVATTGAGLLPLVILVALKTAMDLGFHVREHRAPTETGAGAAV